MARVLLALLLNSRKQLRITWLLLKDARVPRWQKAIPFLSLVYIFSPINLITFAIPLVGQIDDVALLLLAMRVFESIVDPSIRADYEQLSEGESAQN
ncbi:MAG: hypothetical protein CL610_07170 [Anaerolineaceae bacterium]|nr:hypothetical protein [Anaerolineaceae bacterium]